MGFGIDGSIRKIVQLLMLFAAVSCAPIYEHWDESKSDITSEEEPLPATHIVEKGESLYAIAWVYNMSYLDLAKWNDVGPPRYVIHPGQELRLSSPDEVALPASSSEPQIAMTDETPPARPQVAQPSDESNAGLRQPPQKRLPPARTIKSPVPEKSSWLWPASGDLLCRFSENRCRKGVYISGYPGQPIFAAAKGDVVYSGKGFKEYGSLIIIKHQKGYFSAYAHNRSLLVKEGDIVVGGQKIATMGTAKTGQAALYFQVRLNGQLIDPLETLPVSY